MVALPPIRASTALAAYAEPLLEGRSVIVFGDATSGLADRLLERGARLIHFYDPDPARVAEAAARNASRNVTFAPLADGALAIRDAAFELAMVENLARLPAPDELLGRIRQALSPRAPALIATPNPDVKRQLLGDSSQPHALDYYAFYDLVAAEFEHVYMLGQTPFVGYAIAAFAPQHEPVPTFDAGFVPGGAEEPEWFIALAGSHELGFEEFSVIQVPFASVRGPTPPPAPARQPVAREPGRGALERSTREEREALEQQLAEREQWIAQLEARATAADTRADEIQAELEEVETRVQQAAERASKFEGKFDTARAEASQARRDAKALREQCSTLEQELAALREELGARRARDEQLDLLEGIEAQARRDIDALEQQLRERAEEIQRLQRELREAERIGKELLGDLSVQSSPDARVAELASRLDALAALNAQREGDLAAARYYVQQLEAELEKAGGRASPPTAKLEQELEQARAELQQQAVLLEQSRSGRGPKASGSS